METYVTVLIVLVVVIVILGISVFHTKKGLVELTIEFFHLFKLKIKFKN